MDQINWTKLPSLTALRAFDAAARCRSFSGAARNLNVTHAAVAQQVGVLERYLGVVLLRRSPRGVELTAEGARLAERLSLGFSIIAEGVETVQEQAEARPVRVTTTSFFAEAVIFPRISEFWREHPDVELSFTPSDKALDLVAEGFDLAVRAGDGDWPDLEVTHLLDSPTLACTAPKLVDDPDTDWQKVPWLLPDHALWEDDVLRLSGIDPATAPKVNLGNPALEIRAAEEGMGLVLEAEIDLRRHLERGTLKPAPISINHVSKFFLVTPHAAPRAAVRYFMQWMRTACGGAT